MCSICLWAPAPLWACDRSHSRTTESKFEKPQGLLALSFGFAAFPTALAFLTGIGGMLFFAQVAPISFQAESIAAFERGLCPEVSPCALTVLIWNIHIHYYF